MSIKFLEVYLWFWGGKWYVWQFDNLYISWKFGIQKFMKESYWRMRENGRGRDGHKDLQYCHSELIFDHQFLQFLITNYQLFLPIQPDAAFVWFSFSRAARTSLLKGELGSHSNNYLKRAYWLSNKRSFMVWATFFETCCFGLVCVCSVFRLLIALTIASS